MIHFTPMQPDIYNALPCKQLSDYFRRAGDMLTDESVMLSEAIYSLLADSQPTTNKNIILWLIQRLECTSDIITSDIIRKTLEIVVGYTMDDI